jgi:branched-chain amino acid transport system ATP-binding protein
MDLAHRVYLLETGSIVASGDADTIRGDDAVRKAYLGY